MKKKKNISTHYVAAIIIFICAVVISLGLFLLYVQKSIDTNSQKVVERIHEKRLPEAPRTRNEQHLALIMHNDFDKARLVDVIAMIAD